MFDNGHLPDRQPFLIFLYTRPCLVCRLNNDERENTRPRRRRAPTTHRSGGGVTTGLTCRLMMLKRGALIASFALRPRRAHSSLNKRSAKAPKNFARRRRS